jgi:hypothetical protein
VLYLSAFSILTQISEMRKRIGGLGEWLLLGAVETVLALVLIPPLLLVLVLVGLVVAAEWCHHRITATAVRCLLIICS